MRVRKKTLEERQAELKEKLLKELEVRHGKLDTPQPEKQLFGQPTLHSIEFERNPTLNEVLHELTKKDDYGKRPHIPPRRANAHTKPIPRPHTGNKTRP